MKLLESNIRSTWISKCCLPKKTHPYNPTHPPGAPLTMITWFCTAVCTASTRCSPASIRWWPRRSRPRWRWRLLARGGWSAQSSAPSGGRRRQLGWTPRTRTTRGRSYADCPRSTRRCTLCKQKYGFNMTILTIFPHILESSQIKVRVYTNKSTTTRNLVCGTILVP